MAEYRDFKGVWIPKDVWLDDRLNALEKVILAEVDSLDNGERGCFASNAHIADFCQCSETKVSTAISKLIDCGYLYVQKFDGRQRELKSCLSKFERQTLKNCKADIKNLKDSNTVNNTDNNTEKKERKKDTSHTSYDSIIDGFTNNAELKTAIVEFVKMRKLAKKPMTDRALSLLLRRLQTLSTDESEQIEIINQSIVGNWQSVYPLKDSKTGAKTEKTTDLDDIF